MSEILGKKRYNIDQPSPPSRVAVAGSGFQIMHAGTTIANPTLDVTLAFENPTSMNNSPAFDAPTIAWT